MNDLLYLTVSILFFFSVFRNSLFWLHLWQVKEYRLDRVKIHLFETQQGRQLLYGKLTLLKNLFIILYFLVFLQMNSLTIYSFLIFLIFLISDIVFLYDLKNKKVNLPEFTPKIIVIFVLTFSLLLLLYLFPPLDRFFWLLFLDKLALFIIALFMGLFWIPAEFYRDSLVYKASKKREKYRSLQVIGITGSYGKGSTKEYVSAILSSKFEVLKTKETFNTLLGISRVILSGLNRQTKIFVVEMGAYKRGDIFEICQLCKPNVSILTSVNDQHLSLFGNITNTKSAKYELIESLQRNGLALFNGNNSIVSDLHQITKKKKIIYFVDYDNKMPEKEKKLYDVYAHNIIQHKFSIEFDAIIKNDWKESIRMKVNLLGVHNIENLLPAIYLGNFYGLSIPEIKTAVKKITPLKKTMEPYVGENGSILIDDTFNANPQSAIAASNYMKIFKGKKIFILQPMIELGKSAYHDHMDVAEKIARTSDQLILTNTNFSDAIRKGVEKLKGKCAVFVKNPREIATFVSALKRGDVVVFEGKETALSLSLVVHSPIQKKNGF